MKIQSPENGNFYIDENGICLTDYGLVQVFRDDNFGGIDFDLLFDFLCFGESYRNFYHYDRYEEEDMRKEICDSKHITFSLNMDYYGYEINIDNTFDKNANLFATVEKEKIYREYNCKKITKSILEKVKSTLEAEVNLICADLAGEVYGIEYLTTTEEPCICGFYGEDADENGINETVGKISFVFNVDKSKELYQMDEMYDNISSYTFYKEYFEESGLEIEDFDEIISIAGEMFSKKDFLKELTEELVENKNPNLRKIFDVLPKALEEEKFGHII